MRGLVTVGGVRRDITPEMTQAIKETLTRVKEEFSQLVEILLAKDSFLNRAETTGILEHKVAVDLGVVGSAARINSCRWTYISLFARPRPAALLYGLLLAGDKLGERK